METNTREPYYRYCNKGHATMSREPDITTTKECGWPNCHEPNLPYLYEGMGYVSEVLGIFKEAEAELHWSIKSDGPHFYVDCSDFFALASSDLEEIEVEDLSLLRQCFNDLHAIGGYQTSYLSELFVCRKRQEKPMNMIFVGWQNSKPEIAAMVENYRNKSEDYWDKWNAEHPKGK